MSSIFTPELTAALVAHDRLYDVKEFAKVAYALLGEGVVLLRAHAGEGPAIERFVATVEKVRAQYRAAKEAPAAAPVVDWSKFVPKEPPEETETGSGWKVASGAVFASWDWTTKSGCVCVFDGQGQAPTVLARGGSEGRSFDSDRWTIIRHADGRWADGYGPGGPILAPAPEPSAPPLRGFELKGLWSDEELAAHERRATSPPSSDPVTVATGGVPLLASKLGERICDCGDSEQEHSGPDHHCPRDQGVFSHARRPRPSDAVLLVGGHRSGWGVNCAWKGCGFRTPEFTVEWAAREAIVDHIKSTHLTPAAPPAAPASEPAGRPLSAWARWLGEQGLINNGYAALIGDKAAALEAELADTKADLALSDLPREELLSLIKEATDGDPNAKCLHCGGIVSKTVRNHWQDCEKHPARAEVEQLRRDKASANEAFVTEYDRAKAAAAKAEQLRAKLAEAEESVANVQRGAYEDGAAAADVEADKRATARVRSMREAAAKVADRHEYGRTRGCLCNACKSGREIRALSDDQPVPAKQAESLETGRSVALPLHAGTATDAGGEAVTMRAFRDDENRNAADNAQCRAEAAAIKAAVDKANNRAADAFRMWRYELLESSQFRTMTAAQFEAWLRSGEDAPGAVGK